jgi:hypothetical protein
MPESTLTLPQETTWKLLAVSPDMMDTQFCNKRFPFRWRSSLAVSAFEPKPEGLSEELCEGRITFLKITATITGYQPSREETAEGHASFPNVPTEELSRIIDQYFACYGALLNVAVFPNPNRKIVDERIAIDFAGQKLETLLPNPFASGGATFEAVGQANNRITDIFPVGGDGEGELDLFEELVVTLPATSRVEAKVVHFNDVGVEMEAFKGNTSIGSQAAGLEQGQIHQLVIQGEGIDRVVFSVPQNRAALQEFAYLGKASTPFSLIEFPHIIDVEPKIRDLVQASSETGEILTSSKSNVKTNKSLTHTDSSETGYKLGATLGLGDEKSKSSITGELNHKNTETEQDNWSVATDASRERQEKEGSTTQISQLYNLLSSYHIGTNRALFLMLPRPHVLQPTDHRTFVDGLRQIEGVQEFLLIVARPPEMKGLCVEAFLETGHFPEGLTPEQSKEEFDESEEVFTVTAFADNGWFSGDTENIQATHAVEVGRVVDIRPERGPDAGHPGMREIANNSNSRANSSLESYNYQRIADAEVQVSGQISGSGGQGDKARFNRTYRVFTRSVEPKPNSGEPKVPLEKLLITSRGLCVCFRSGEDCPNIEISTSPVFDPGELIAARIVDEREITISPALLTRSVSRETRLPAMKELLTKIQNAMTTSGRLPQRRAFDEAPGFLGSDYFKDQVKKALPRDQLNRTLANLSDLPREVLDSFGKTCTVAEALKLDLAQFVQKTGLSVADAVKARQSLLGLVDLRGREY